MWRSTFQASALRRGAVPASLGLILTMAGCAAGIETSLDSDEGVETLTAEEQVADVEAWRARREASLRRPDGWLSLVGLEWIREGRSLVGGAPEADVRLPEKAAAAVGWIEWSGTDLRFVPSDAEVLADGEPVEGTIALRTDLEEGGPTELTHGSLRFFVIDRDGDLAVRIKDSESPLIASFDGIESWPIDPEWRIEARFEAEVSQIEVPDVLGRVTLQTSPGVVVFDRKGETHRLLALPGGSDGSLFLVFGDTTNGKETYGGGRFVYSEPPDGDRVVVDFNKSYNPPCVFTPYATCPLPPPSNRLPFPIRAGEKMWGAEHH